SLSLLCRPRPPSRLFPYTTLFRSVKRLSLFHSLSPWRSSTSRWVVMYGDDTRGQDVEVPGGRAMRVVVADNDASALELVLTDLRSEEHTSELQSRFDLVCRLLLET